MVVASDHWNFDVRGFNPGGNHGSFLRISTHSTLMFAGGDQDQRSARPRSLKSHMTVLALFQLCWL